MSYPCRDLGPLAAQFPDGGLFASWLAGVAIPGSRSATAEFELAIGAGGGGRAPLWGEDRFEALLPPAWRELAGGPEVVVTGQQPGVLGGTLLTLYKIATAVALARERTAGGRPTVPVFWSGDDDDDLAEALAPVGWDEAAADLWRSPERPHGRRSAEERRLVGGLGAGVWAAPALDQIGSPAADALQRDLVSLLTEAVAQDQKLGPGQVQLIARVFAGTDLVILRGNDQWLHRTAAPFYEQISGRVNELADLVRERGRELTAAGYHAQINERSLSRVMYRVQGGQRQAVTGFSGAEAETLRPGVMLRSPLQDWLLQPAAVVVGPGELAYLRQLDPLYAALGQSRCALVPRLAAWILPEGPVGERLVSLLRPGNQATWVDPEALADQVAGTVRAELTAVLTGELGLDTARAAELAANRARRFRKGVAAMFGTEVERQRRARLKTVPTWVLPDGHRQERALGLLCALGLWGGELVDSVLAVATEHLRQGGAGRWREHGILVPAWPGQTKGTVAS